MKSKRRPRKIRSKDRKGIVLLTAGLVGLATIAFAAVRPTQATAKSEPLPPPVVFEDDDLVSVPTPIRSIAKGELLSDVEFTHVKWPKSRLTGDYVTDLEHYRSHTSVVSLPKLLPIPISALRKDPVDINGLVEGIPEGMRAITVKVDAEAAVEGWALPGNFVDVMVIRASQDAAIGLETKVIAENVRILSAGRSIAAGQASGDTAPKTPSTVTLLVTQEDALKIKTAASIGKLNFSLRGAKDQLPATATAMNQKKLLGGNSPQPKRSDMFKGYATGPDGKRYILNEESRWLRTADNSQSGRPDAPTTPAETVPPAGQ